MTVPKGSIEPSRDLVILIADDHWVVRQSLKQVAKGLRARVRTTEASTFQEALNALEKEPLVDLLLFDLVLPDAQGFEGLKKIRRRYPTVPIVVVSVHEDSDYVLKAIQHGVIGYIPKTADANEIRHSLELVLEGGVAFPRQILSRVRPDETPGAPSIPASADTRLALLTHRESEILALMGHGRSVLDIAGRLMISRQTVRVHLGNLMKKLDFATREGAIRFAVENEIALASQIATSGAKNASGGG